MNSPAGKGAQNTPGISQSDSEAEVWRRVLQGNAETGGSANAMPVMNTRPYERQAALAPPNSMQQNSIQGQNTRSIMPGQTAQGIIQETAPAPLIPAEREFDLNPPANITPLLPALPYNLTNTLQNNQPGPDIQTDRTAGMLETSMYDSLADAAFYKRLARRLRNRRDAATCLELCRRKRDHARRLAATVFILTGEDPANGYSPSMVRGITSCREAIRNMCIHEKQDAVRYMQMSVNASDPMVSRLCAELSRDCERMSECLRDML